MNRREFLGAMVAVPAAAAVGPAQAKPSPLWTAHVGGGVIKQGTLRAGKLSVATIYPRGRSTDLTPVLDRRHEAFVRQMFDRFGESDGVIRSANGAIHKLIIEH